MPVLFRFISPIREKNRLKIHTFSFAFPSLFGSSSQERTSREVLKSVALDCEITSRTKIRRVLLVGEESAVLEDQLRKAGIEPVSVEDSPQVVITYGGDGTLLGADREYPDLPKLPIRRDSEYTKCEGHDNGVIFERLARGTHSSTLLPRLICHTKGHEVLAINDIVMRNGNITSAVRFRVWIDDLPYSGEMMGDGIVVATPYGSSAYYRTITHSVIRVGMGVAFNNSTEAVSHLVLGRQALIRVQLTRGPATVVNDNTRDPIEIQTGDELTIQVSNQQAEIWELGNLMCLECRKRSTGRPAGKYHVLKFDSNWTTNNNESCQSRADGSSSEQATKEENKGA